jgi:hypothetical protein
MVRQRSQHVLSHEAVQMLTESLSVIVAIANDDSLQSPTKIPPSEVASTTPHARGASLPSHTVFENHQVASDSTKDTLISGDSTQKQCDNPEPLLSLHLSSTSTMHVPS